MLIFTRHGGYLSKKQYPLTWSSMIFSIKPGILYRSFNCHVWLSEGFNCHHISIILYILKYFLALSSWKLSWNISWLLGWMGGIQFQPSWLVKSGPIWCSAGLRWRPMENPGISAGRSEWIFPWPSGKLTVCELERSTIFDGKIHYFDWAILTIAITWHNQRVFFLWRWSLAIWVPWLGSRHGLAQVGWLISCQTCGEIADDMGHSIQRTGFMLFLVSAPLKLSQVGVPWGSVYKGYIWYYYSIGSSLIVRPQNA